MANVFKDQQDFTPNVQRNNFDLSHTIHGTYKVGYNYPVLRLRGNPGDSFRINLAFALNGMPTVFPIQSGMRAKVQLFKVYHRHLVKDFKDWISGHAPDGFVMPYMKQPAAFYKTGSLADHLGIPTTAVSTRNYTLPFYPFSDTQQQILTSYVGQSVNFDASDLTSQTSDEDKMLDTTFSGSISAEVPTGNIASEYRSRYYFVSHPAELPTNNIHLQSFYNSLSFINYDNYNPDNPLVARYNTPLPLSAVGNVMKTNMTFSSNIPAYFCIHHYTGQGRWIDAPIAVYKRATFSGNSLFLEDGNTLESMINAVISSDSYTVNSKLYFSVLIHYGNGFDYNTPLTLDLTIDSSQPQDISELSLDVYDPDKGGLAISAIPFRAYEAIMNCYYRNDINDPFKVNGKPVYNRFVTTDDGGADTTPYELQRHDWELDFLTSCTPSPQQGNAPMVGVSALGDVSIEDENGVTTLKADFDGHGHSVRVTQTSPLASITHARTLADLATYGFNINDFRNVNAFQRFLEASIRKGYKYIDFMKSHHGVSPKGVELGMPEFLGGLSRSVNFTPVTQTSASQGDNLLGSYAGQSSVFGNADGSIEVYCDDYCEIMAILTIVPTPSYSQLLSKDYFTDNPLDYQFPEFNKLGMQPVTYKEVCPVESFVQSQTDSTRKFTDTFGYNRPAYDKISHVDEVHGQFRTTMRNFLVSRVFKGRPQLGAEFLHIDPETVNDIFQVTQPDEDTFAGQIKFDISAKRPIPRIVLPSID
ncbi:MAG: hypothetical protein IJ761_00140 [Bacteroidales bacterium]|nr:hypothetical protein [Bacteroidales bacterium]